MRSMRNLSMRETDQFEGEGSRPFEVRSGDMNLRAGHFAFLDVAFQFEVGIKIDASHRSDRYHARREIQSRKTCSVFRIKWWRSAG